MKPTAIVYTSNTGHTRQYALLLGKQIGLPVYSLEETNSHLSGGSPVIYLGWIHANHVKGYSAAARRFAVCAVCGVGLCDTGTLISEVRKATAIAEDIPLFTLQGGFDIQKLSGVYKLMMTIMVKTAGKGLAEKQDRTPEEDVMLEMLTKGGNRVSAENLADVLDWWNRDE